MMADDGVKGQLQHGRFMDYPMMESIIQIQHVDRYVHSKKSMQLSIDCLALDFFDNVFHIGIEFFPSEVQLRDEILKDLVEESLWAISGACGIASDKGMRITLYEPTYKNIAPENVQDVEATFQSYSENQ